LQEDINDEMEIRKTKIDILRVAVSFLWIITIVWFIYLFLN
jgi:hypothetical protein